MFRSGGTTWLLVFIGLIFVAVITAADQNYDDLYPDDPNILEECKDEDEEGSNNLSVSKLESKLLCQILIFSSFWGFQTFLFEISNLRNHVPF